MYESVQLFAVMNDGDDDESFDIVTMFNDCTPPLMKVSNVTTYKRSLIYSLTWKNLLQIVMCQCTLLICVYSVLPKTLFDSGTQLVF